MAKYPTTSLIIATYNWATALELVLMSVQKQSLLPNEVIIADDGSTEETKLLIQKFQKIFPVPLVHVWHKDDGFRLSEIRNKAIKEASYDYIIQIDGDVILHKHFIKGHLKMAKKNVFLRGSRVLLSNSFSKKVLQEKIIKFRGCNSGMSNRMNGFYFPFLTKILKAPTSNSLKVAVSARGCNMSFWKSDLIEINGYNEAMTGWGREDSEISVRLINAGIKREIIKFNAIQYHIYHPFHSKNEVNKNHKILENVIQEKIVYCQNGLANH